jgi:hypothetical protein
MILFEEITDYVDPILIDVIIKVTNSTDIFRSELGIKPI